MPARPPRDEAGAVDGARLWTATQGDRLPMVLCHGGPGLSDNLGRVAVLVDDVATVHRFDQRGGGRSSSEGPYDVETFVADLEGLRAHWAHDRWVVAGHSWGANLALLYALRHPGRTAGVISISGLGVRWGWQEATRRHRLARLSPSERDELRRLESAAVGAESADRARLLRLLWTTDFADRSTADRVLDEAPLYDHPRNDAVFRGVPASHRSVLAGGHVEAALPGLRMPVHVIHGAADADPSRAVRLAAACPRGHCEILDGAGHSPWFERPAALRRALRAALDAAAETPTGDLSHPGPEAGRASPPAGRRPEPPV